MKIIHIMRRDGPVGGIKCYVWETMRARAKLGHQVQVPNSEIIARQLAQYYPKYAHKLTRFVMPGVVGVLHSVPQAGGIIGFVGRERQDKIFKNSCVAGMWLQQSMR